MLLRMVCAVSAMVVLSACGAVRGHVETKKIFELQIDAPNDSLRVETERLIKAYNDQVGFSALRLAKDPAAANSSVQFQQGLQQREGKIGFGSWEVSTKRLPSVSGFSSGGTKVRSYSMHVEFDLDYMQNHMGKDEESRDWKELFLLFSHEVGHGFQMEHIEDESDVMNPIVSWHEGIRFDDYFRNVAHFFSTP